MKDQRFGKYFYIGVTAISVITVSILLVFLFLERTVVWGHVNKILSILAPIILGAVLAFLLAPIYNFSKSWINSGKKKSEWLGKMVGTLSSLIFLTAVVVGLCYMLIPQLYSSIAGIVNTMPTYIENIYNFLTEVFENNPELEKNVLAAYERVVEWAVGWANESLLPNFQNLNGFQGIEKILGGVSSGVVGIINFVKNLFIGLIVMVYLLNIKDTLSAQCKKIVYSVFSIKMANAVVEEFRYVHKVFLGFIRGKLIDSLIIGILCFILMKLFRLPFELLISVIVGVTNVIPFFGPFIGAIPSAVLVFLISPKQCLYFIGLILLLQQFDGNILGPKILGNTTNLPSFWVLFSILLFGGLFGFAGMILAVPITAVIFHLFGKLQQHFLRKKNLPSDTADYMSLKSVDEKNGTFIKE